eukprot:14824002-Alexandrium_andersonii.AAC.1
MRGACVCGRSRTMDQIDHVKSILIPDSAEDRAAEEQHGLRTCLRRKSGCPSCTDPGGFHPWAQEG